MKKYLLHIVCILLTLHMHAQVIPNGSTLPAATGVKLLPMPYTSVPVNYLRTYSPQVPIADSAQVNINTLVDNVQTAIIYADGYGRTIQTVAKQLSPLKKDNVGVTNYDAFGRTGTQAYMPFVALNNDGLFKTNAFAQDSAFYKALYPTEQVIYSQTQYDGSPMNLPVKVMAAGNEWGGANRGNTLNHRSNTAADSIRYWNINIINEDDVPLSTSYYITASLNVKEITNAQGIKSISYTDLAGRTILTKTQEANNPSTGHIGWLCTYYVYDEMGSLRTVIPPKATNQLITNNWVLTTANLQGHCYSYFYDNRGRQITKCIPGKGKSYVAYDMYDRPVMTQDPNLRLTNKWDFVLYDAQSRPSKTGIITSTLIKDSIQAQAARSLAYPTLAGTYIVMTETYYDNYDWVAATSAPVGTNINTSYITGANFITNYNTAPDYAQPLTQSQRIRGTTTGTKTIELGSSNYSYTVTFYDNYGRSIQTQQAKPSGAAAGSSQATIQYSYKGTVLRSHNVSSRYGGTTQTHTTLTKYTYDHAARVLTAIKNIDNTGDKIINQFTYEETGQVKKKTLGAGLQEQIFAYNMQGMLTSINSPYVKLGGIPGGTGKEFFGEILSYTSGFTSNQYNGNIAGVQWKNAGDSTARAYGYTYDNVGRLTRADFAQQNSGSTAWTSNKVNYTVSNITYDAGGNILTMSQRGLLGVGGNALIDSLAYTYQANTNRLLKVADKATQGGILGDFKDTTSTTDDYTYDANGNIVKDNNRRLHNTNGSIGTLFNLLDKPDSMAVAGKSCTYYTYDAAGATLSKTVKDYRTNTAKRYTYIGGYTYLSNYAIGATPAPDTLQYAMFEEGRIRWKVVGGLSSVVFDYMIKDHAGNVRTMITDEVRTDDYPAATMDTTRAIKNKENEIYAGLDLTRVAKPAGYPAPTLDNFPIPNANNYVAKVQGNVGSQKIGPSITLKVMKDDKFDFYVSSYYQAAVTNAPTASPLLDIVNGLASGISGSAVLNTHGVTNAQLQTAFTPNVTSFLTTQPPYITGSTVPLAYVNWVLFDEQFNLVRSTSSFERVSTAGVIEPHVRTGMPITQSGYLYIYVSNSTPNIPVYFDNLKVKHIRGALLETNEFYPFGLTMAGISSKAAGKLQNKYLYNAGTELNTDFDVNLYETNFRSLDPQIGRFWQVDPMADAVSEQSPYVYANNNPISFNDPLGLLSDSLHPVTLSEVVVTSKVKVPNAFVPYINFPNGKPGNIASIKDWPLSFSRDRTNDLVDSWALGLGSTNRIYLPYHPMTKRLKNAYQVNRARAYFYKKYLSKFNSGASMKGASVTNFKGSFGFPQLMFAGTDIVEQYVGSMNIDIQVDEKGENMLFIVGNNTSKTSALYHAADSHERTPGNAAMGNMYQVYIWSEPINAGFSDFTSPRPSSPSPTTGIPTTPFQ